MERNSTSNVSRSLAALAQQANRCERCPLYKDATQAVFGEGNPAAEIMLVGEQPGAQEDVQGHPFVGPAGRILNRALEAAGLARDAVYITNTVKHFKHEARGNRRLHKRPNHYEIEQCRWWLNQELQLVQPSLLVALGATAANALAGRTVTIARDRGRLLTFPNGRHGMVTIHPSAILRIREKERRAAAFTELIENLRTAAALVRSSARIESSKR